MMNTKHLASDVVLMLEKMLETKHTCNTSLEIITGCPKKLIHKQLAGQLRIL